ncbi:hypothetical protein HGM15179_002540 [Zosterops borbonicus]|uniref:Uncharacterized protein n=1 Tax=Zosterops borbonicus TaxID=364589 RepID=A0A8K1GUZ0_9PASS|nr:hypothetical protein HGM15179_002540 [Zosterops borbonicus]
MPGSSLSSTSILESFSAGLLCLSIPTLRWHQGLVQHLTLALVKPREIPMDLSLKLVQVLLDIILSFRCVISTTQLGVMCEFLEGTLHPTVYVIREDIK